MGCVAAGEQLAAEQQHLARLPCRDFIARDGVAVGRVGGEGDGTVEREVDDADLVERELLGRPLIELAAPGFVRPLSEALESTLDGQQIDNVLVREKQ